MAISVSFSEGEALEFRGWTARMCFKCRCARAFIVHERIEQTSIAISHIPVSRSERRTRTCVCQCDFCGNSVRFTPKVMKQSYGGDEELPALIAETFPEITPEQAPHAQLTGVVTVLIEHFLKLHEGKLSIRRNIGLIAFIYGVMAVCGVLFALPGRNAQAWFETESTFFIIVGGFLVLSLGLAVGIFRVFARASYRSACKELMRERFQEVRKLHQVSEADIEHAKEELTRLL